MRLFRWNSFIRPIQRQLLLLQLVFHQFQRLRKCGDAFLQAGYLYIHLL